MKAPTYNQTQTVRARSAASPTALKIPLSTGQNVQAAAQGLNREVMEHAQKMRKDYDSARSREAVNSFLEESRAKHNEFKQLRGREARELGQKYDEWYDKRVGDIAKELDNDNQKLAFTASAQARRQVNLNSLASHEAAEHQRYKLSVHHGDLAHTEGDVMLYFNNPDVMDGVEDADGNRIGGINQRIDNSFDETFPGIDTSAQRMKAKASAHSLRIQLVAEDNPAGAMELLEKNKTVVGGNYQKLKGMIEKSALGHDAQNLSDQISLLETYKEQNQAVNSIKDEELREETRKKVRNRQQQREQEKKEALEAEANTLTAEVIEAFNNGATKDQVLDIATDTEEQKVAKQLISLTNSLYKPKPTDQVKRNEAMEDIDARVLAGENPTREYLLRTYGPSLSGNDFEALERYNRIAINTRNKTAVQTAKRKVKAMYDRGDFGKPKSPSAMDSKADILYNMDEWLEANPNQDPTDFINKYIQTEVHEAKARKLTGWWFTDARKRKKLAKSDDIDLFAQYLDAHGKDINGYKPETIESMMISDHFLNWKMEQLRP